MDGRGNSDLAGVGPGSVGRPAGAGLRHSAGDGDAPARRIRNRGHQPVFPLRGQPARAQAVVLAAKVRALLQGRFNVSFEDIRSVYLPALRHRVLMNFEAQAENIPSDQVLASILNDVKEKAPEGPVVRRVEVAEDITGKSLNAIGGDKRRGRGWPRPSEAVRIAGLHFHGPRMRFARSAEPNWTKPLRETSNNMKVNPWCGFRARGRWRSLSHLGDGETLGHSAGRLGSDGH